MKLAKIRGESIFVNSILHTTFQPLASKYILRYMALIPDIFRPFRHFLTQSRQHINVLPHMTLGHHS